MVLVFQPIHLQTKNALHADTSEHQICWDISTDNPEESAIIIENAQEGSQLSEKE